jgi:hypothetical protein
MKLSKARQDHRAREAGAWVIDIPWAALAGAAGLAIPSEADLAELKSVAFRVRGLRTMDAQRIRMRETGKLDRKTFYAGAPDPADDEKIASTVLKEAVLLDVAGLEGDDGAKLAFSPELAATLIDDPDYALIRAGIAWAAASVAEVGKAALEDDVGNSGPSSNGSTRGASTKKASARSRRKADA